MSASPNFWSQPLRYLRWASREKPAIFWSIAVGATGPPMLFVVPPIRARFFNDGPREAIPFTYPIPAGPRQIPSGYDD